MPVLDHELMVEASFFRERKKTTATRQRELASNLLRAMSDRRYDPSTIEPKWQALWARERTWEVPNEPAAGSVNRAQVDHRKKS